MYIDPPYPGNKCNYAHNMRDWEDHYRLAKRLSTTACRWILSSYDMPEMRNLFKDNLIVPIEAFSGMNSEKNGNTRVLNKEILILNYEPEGTLSLRDSQTVFSFTGSNKKKI